MSEILFNQHKIVVDDCLNYLKTMDAKSIDCVVTSPPYNIGIPYHTYHDKKPRDAYLTWLYDISVEISRVLKQKGSYFLNMGSTNIDPWIDIDVAKKLQDLFCLQNRITWVKSISIREDSYGHFKPINSKRFLNQNSESIFHFTIGGNVPIDRLAIGVPFMDKTNISRRQHAQDKRCSGNNWFIPYETVKSKTQKFNHPASFPIDLASRCIKLCGHDIGIVLDPFLGAGTTLIAANRLGWSGIGIDIDQQYANTAYQRLQDEK